MQPTKVESGSDDLDNSGHLVHFFDWSSGSICKLNYLDVTRILKYIMHVFVRICMVLASGKRVNLGTGEGESCKERDNLIS